MSTDFKAEESDVEVGRAAAMMAFSDSSPFEPASAIAIRALAMQTHRLYARVPRSKLVEKWDDTGESLIHQARTESLFQGAISK